MSEADKFVPVKKMLSIINSCETEKQLKSTLRIVDNYIRQIKQRGVVNSDLVRKRLMKEFKQKKFQIKMIKSFVQQYDQEYQTEAIKIKTHIFVK